MARRFDGRAYEPADLDATGLLAASNRSVWEAVKSRALTSGS